MIGYGCGWVGFKLIYNLYLLLLVFVVVVWCGFSCAGLISDHGVLLSHVLPPWLQVLPSSFCFWFGPFSSSFLSPSTRRRFPLPENRSVPYRFYRTVCLSAFLATQSVPSRVVCACLSLRVLQRPSVPFPILRPPPSLTLFSKAFFRPLFPSVPSFPVRFHVLIWNGSLMA